MAAPRLSLIAAMSENGVIGKDNAMPWHISADLKNFRRLTMGKPVIMGRRTFESIGKPLPGRPNLVISRDPTYRPAGAVVCDGPDAARDAASKLAGDARVDEIMVIGGAEIYAAFLPNADRLYVTEVHARIDGDARFPAFDPGEWVEISRDARDPETGDGPRFSFVMYDRAPAGPWRKCVSDAFEVAQEELIAEQMDHSTVENGQDG